MSPDPEPPEVTAPPVPPLDQAVAADQAAAQLTAGHGHHGPLHSHCENCGTKLEGPFCHRCGQHDFDFSRSFGHVFHEALENFFHFEGKFFRNIVTLLFHPGRLTAEFHAGKRAAQMPPLRLYIFVSILFFFVSFAGSKRSDGLLIPDMDAGARAEFAQELQKVAKENPDQAARIQKFQELLPTAGAPAARPADASPAPPPAAAADESALERSLREKSAYALTHQNEIAEAFLHAIPKMLLFCLPIFALYLRLLFRKAGLAYLHHLVIALHFHTFIFLWMLCRDGWAGAAGLVSHGLRGWIVFAGNLWLMLYPLLMLRRLFGNSWRKTLVKTFLLAGAYGLTLGLGFLVVAAVVFLST